MLTSELRDAENRSQDRSAFAAKVHKSCGDRRIRNFMDRALVNRHEIVSLLEGEAFEQALSRKSYKPYEGRRVTLQAKPIFNSDLHDELISVRRLAVIIGLAVISLTLLDSFLDGHLLNFGIILSSALLIGITAAVFSYVRLKVKLNLHDWVFAAALSVASLASFAVIMGPHFIFHVRWEPVTYFVIWATAAVTGYVSGIKSTFIEALFLCRILFNSTLYPMRSYVLTRWRDAWLDDCVESVIIPQAILAINDVLGEDKDRLLVEQDSEGLRKLQDPNYTVTTRSEERIASTLLQMDGGSIALAGPRGAGKSTLLRQFSEPVHASYRSGISIYLAAPAEYVPRDFIAELLQQLCKAFLDQEQCLMPRPIYKENWTFNLRQFTRKLLGVVWVCLRGIAGLAVLLWLTWPFLRPAYLHMHQVILAAFSHWYQHLLRYTLRLWHQHKIPLQIAMILIAIIVFPGPKKWRKYFRGRREPGLAKIAREYLERLQVEKTITLGTGVNLPIIKSSSFSVTKGSSAKYSPWTLPELVSNTRSFMGHLAEYFEHEDYAVIVGIDEIDRIGSLEHAERFIGEIKAIFGIERCFFLVSVAEDVGSVFAQRATAGRSILENAFDTTIVVEPLRLDEAREFLLKRVPGFTDSFAYLVHALSGGLPRELIRVTRRLVEINENLVNSDRHPRLEDLASVLVNESIAEAIRATRSQMSRLILSANWAGVLENLHSAGAVLSGVAPSSMDEKYFLIRELSKPQPVEPAVQGSNAPGDVGRDEDRAKIAISDLSAFAYFGITVIDSFGDTFFNLQEVQSRTETGSEGSYEKLALARTELTVSAASSRMMLQRFRKSLKLEPTQVEW